MTTMTSNDLVFGYADRILNAMSFGENHLNKGQFFHVEIKQKVMRTFNQTTTTKSALDYDPYKVFNLRSFINEWNHFIIVSQIKAVGVSVDGEHNSIYPKGYLPTKKSAAFGKYKINDQYIGD